MSEAPGEPAAPSPPDDERKRLELEKLRLETEALRHNAHRDALTSEKLRNDIAESKNAPRRALASTFATILLAIGTIALSAAGFVLNTTISRAADHQRDFDNYGKLTEQFSKGGSARVGAIVGFEKLLGPGSSYGTQVATVLANDLFDETNPVAVHAIVSDLRFAGFRAFAQVRDVQNSARLRLYNDAAQYMGRQGRRYSATAAKELRDAAHADFSRREGSSFFDTDVDYVFSEILQLQQQQVEGHLEWGAPVEIHGDWTARYARDSAAVLESAVVLKALLADTPPPDALDASDVWLPLVHWEDHRLAGIILKSAFVSGHVEGADFSNSDLTYARLAVQRSPDPSYKYVTSFCGANLARAEIGGFISDERTAKAGSIELDDFSIDPKFEDVSDFTASNWWAMNNLTPTTTAILERKYPRAEQERLRKLPREGQVRLCTERRHLRPSPAPAG